MRSRSDSGHRLGLPQVPGDHHFPGTVHLGYVERMRHLVISAGSLLIGCHGTPAVDSEDSVPLEFDDDLGVACPAAPLALPAPPAALPSFNMLPTSNGWTAATFDVGLAALTTWMDHPAKNPTSNSESRDRLYDAYWGIRTPTGSYWLNEVPISNVRYAEGTGILEISQEVDDIEITTRIWAPFTEGGERDLVFTATVTNNGDTPVSSDLFSIQNARPAADDGFGESVAASGNGILETSSSNAVLHYPLSTPTGRAAAPAGDPQNPWIRHSNGEDLGDSIVSGNDVAVGYQWELGSLQPGKSATRGVLLSWSDQVNTLESHVSSFVDGRSAETLLANELQDWDAFHAVETPPSLSADELAIYRQSTAVLRMAQVRTPGGGHGQLLASLPPGNWNISWPRDASYAIVALIESGHTTEAKDALAFMLNSESGQFADTLGVEDYAISVARYYGDGTEESDGATCSDGSDAGPNIELDNFGLFLWAFTNYAAANPEDPWINEALPTVQTGVAEVLSELIDPNRDLLTPDSSIWERHWNDCFPNGRKHFTYSTLHAAAGLRDFGEQFGLPELQADADRLRGGLLRSAADHGPVTWLTEECPFLASSPEETCDDCGPYDASVIEAINRGVFRPESSLAIGTIDGLQTLRLENGSPGFLRTDDGTGTLNPFPWYDDQEWVVIDLRMAVAYHRVGEALGEPIYSQNAETLLAWITAHATANHGLIAELLSDGVYTADDDAFGSGTGQDLGGEAQGAVPMAGFGAGAYILAVEEIRAD